MKATSSAAGHGKRKSSTGKDTGTGFEEHVSGVGVGSLFSVWGPNSQQHLQQQRMRVRSRGNGRERTGELANIYGNAGADYPIAGSGQARQSSTAHGTRDRGRSLQALSITPEQNETGKIAHHMQLVNSIINDGSLHNLVFQNGTLNSEYL